MWIFSTVGFFSVVQKKGERMLTVRARLPGDLDELRAQYLPTLGKTEETPRADYRYRARVSRATFKSALARMVEDLVYDNFKNEVARVQGQKRAHAYHDVWDVMAAVQQIELNEEQK